ncbi:class I SAM-dependent methyltransferase [Candidatus Saccharibacteria bacterium]|nr:MAG: class I SAM-dependent methyltransferase [Candidatus Saccharibacteria bacterium]
MGCGGYAYKHAINCGGALFQNGQVAVDYIGIDIAETLHAKESDKLGPNIRVADCSDLSCFEDGKFELVLMRSMFGQFRDRRWRINFDKFAMFGLMEVYRVLGREGAVVIAEENTPWDPYDVEDCLRYRGGFEVTDFAYMREDSWEKERDSEESDWLTMRRKYYDDPPTQKIKRVQAGDAPPYPPYIMVARKPEDSIPVVISNVLLGYNASGAPVYPKRTYTHGSCPKSQRRVPADLIFR